MKLALSTLSVVIGLASPALAQNHTDYRNTRVDYHNTRVDLVRTVKALEADTAHALETARRGNRFSAPASRQALQRLNTLRNQARELGVQVHERDRRDARKEFHDVLQAYGQTVASYRALHPSRALDRDFDRIEQSMDRLSDYFNVSGYRIDRDRASYDGNDRGRWGGQDDHRWGARN